MRYIHLSQMSFQQSTCHIAICNLTIRFERIKKTCSKISMSHSWVLLFYVDRKKDDVQYAMKTSSYADKVINLNCQAIRFAWPWLNSKCWKFNQFSQWITDGLNNLQIYWFSFQCHWTSASDCHSHPNIR